MATFAVVAAVNTTRNGVIGWFAGVLLIGAAHRTADSGNALSDFLTLAFCTVRWGWRLAGQPAHEPR